ncbi:hypothetical protein IO90_09710 [Chryseobacterium sp. FH1]|nr:hypothetical protein IO90_09710 [Chryseobacterium sp. FH1]
MLTSCERKIKNESIVEKDNSLLQSKLLSDTKKFNALAKKDSSNLKKLEEIKLNYKSIVDSIGFCHNWKGKITLLDLDEVDAYSSDTVVMRIGVENIYDKGYQDYFSFMQVKAIPKNGTLYKKLSRIKENSEVVFSGRLLGAGLHDMSPGYEFSNFHIETDFSDINVVK